jgi:hypothetical protein
MSQASGWVITAGCFLMLLGAGFVPAAFKEQSDTTILGVGICLFAFGALTSAAGLYLKARALQSSAPAASAKPQAKRTRGGCDLCGIEVPVIHCRVHEVHLCGNCLSNHYDFRSCAYVPSTRRTASAKTTARFAAKA